IAGTRPATEKLTAAGVAAFIGDRTGRAGQRVEVGPEGARLARGEGALQREEAVRPRPVGAEARGVAVRRVIGACPRCQQRRLTVRPLPEEPVARRAVRTAVTKGALLTDTAGVDADKSPLRLSGRLRDD